MPPGDFHRAAGRLRSAAHLGVLSWSAPLPHPFAWFDPLLHGDRMGEVPNTNLSHADVPELNDRLETLRRQPVLTDDVARVWSDVDRFAVEHGLVLPFARLRTADRFGTRLDPACIAEHPAFRIDLAQLCLREG